MLLINRQINLTSTWSTNCLIVAETANKCMPTFAITDLKLYVFVVTLSTQDFMFSL